MTRILSYNILVGGTRRVDQLMAVLRSAQPDIIGLAEATDPKVVEELASRLGMQFRLSGYGEGARDWHLAVLSRLPILAMHVHVRPAIQRKYLLEVQLQETDGSRLTVFVIHQTSNFHKGAESNRIRRAEVQEILQITAAHQGQPHLIMGDFNSLAPGDSLQASSLIRSALRPRPGKRRLGHMSWRKLSRGLIRSSMRTIINTSAGSFLVDQISPFYARGGIDLLLQAGYVDCFRQVNPDALGFTCPAIAPAGRIDFLFASPELAARLSNSDIVSTVPTIPIHEASDHLAVYADFLTV